MLALAFLAIILPLFLLLVFKLSARNTMLISLVVVTLTALIFWQMDTLAVAASFIQGSHRALTIGLILFGAVLLVTAMQLTGALDRIKSGLYSVSTDMRVQAIIVAFCFVSLLEGISGFGTPAIIAAPLLLVLGFRPVAAASLALLGDTMACTFGAVATPLIVGLENVPIYSSNLVSVVGAQVSVFDLFIGPLLAIGLVATLIFSFGNQSTRHKLKSLGEILPWTLTVGATHAVSAFVFVRLVGPEFTSILAGMTSLSFALITAQNKWLIPTTVWRHEAREIKVEDRSTNISLFKAWLPYIVVIALLLLSRLIEPVKHWLNQTLDLSLNNIFGFSTISSSWHILYSPGIALIAGAVMAILISRSSVKVLGLAVRSSISKTVAALSALIPTLIMVQIFINSGINSAELLSMPAYIAQSLAETLQSLWLIVAPLLGSIGALVSGSATVSTLTMAPVQYGIAIDTGLSFITVLALQMTGAAAGNLIAIHNVVSASTVVGLVHRENIIIRKLIIPTFIYLLVTIAIGAACLWLGQ